MDPLVLLMGVFSPDPFALLKFLIFDKSNVTVLSRSTASVVVGVGGPSDFRSPFPLLVSSPIIPSYLSPPFVVVAAVIVVLRRSDGEG